MTLVLLGLVVLMGACLAAAFLRGSLPPPEVPPPPPLAEAPPPAPAPERVRVRWISPTGHVYGETLIAPLARRPQIRHTVGKGREVVFVASHRDDNGIWVYREVKGR